MKSIFWPDYLSDGNPKLGLERILTFLNKLGNPQDKIQNIFHVAGTNGKGSTTAYLKYILEADGYSVHRYTSPHLVNWNERIEIAGQPITDEYAIELATECKEFAKKNNLYVSYFEGITIIAFLAFLRNPATATILEVGLGGRLDATNVIKEPLVDIITSISMDHTNILGHTIQEIATEKAGIFKENAKLIINKQIDEVYNTLNRLAKAKNNKIYQYNQEWNVVKLKDSFIFKGFNKELELPLPALQGDFQIYNAGGAIASLLAQDKIEISEKAIITGLKNVKWRGRLEDISNNKTIQNLLPNNAEVILDGAHNEDASKELANWINDKNDDKINILIIAMLKRKDTISYIKNLKKRFDYVITTQIANEEDSKDSQILKQEFLDNGWNNIVATQNFQSALEYIKKNFNNQNIRVVIAGSLYLVGEVIEYIN